MANLFAYELGNCDCCSCRVTILVAGCVARFGQGNAPVAGAKVSVYSDPGYSQLVEQWTTDATGAHVFNGQGAAAYYLQIEKTRFVTDRTPFSCSAGLVTRVLTAATGYHCIPVNLSYTGCADPVPDTLTWNDDGTFGPVTLAWSNGDWRATAVKRVPACATLPARSATLTFIFPGASLSNTAIQWNAPSFPNPGWPTCPYDAGSSTASTRYGGISIVCPPSFLFTAQITSPELYGRATPVTITVTE